MRAKSFLYVSLGILALAVAYHLGASAAGAQAERASGTSDRLPWAYHDAATFGFLVNGETGEVRKVTLTTKSWELVTEKK